MLAGLTILTAKTVTISTNSLRQSVIASNYLFPDIWPNRNKIENMSVSSGFTLDKTADNCRI
jgi:hypothetical protein